MHETRNNKPVEERKAFIENTKKVLEMYVWISPIDSHSLLQTFSLIFAKFVDTPQSPSKTNQIKMKKNQALGANQLNLCYSTDSKIRGKTKMIADIEFTIRQLSGRKEYV